MNVPVEQMYRQRKDFTMVALTGITGSGCSDLAELMCKSFEDWKNQVRSSEDIEMLRKGEKRDMVFQREYDLCYHVCEKQYQQFEIIKYRNVLIFCALEFFSHQCKDSNQIRDAFSELIKQKFDKSHEFKDDVENAEYVVDNNIPTEMLKKLGLDDQLCERFLEIAAVDSQEEKRTYCRLLYEIFGSSEFQSFCEKFYDLLKQRDYYAKNFFVNRLATSLRGTGNPMKIIGSNDFVGNDSIFTVVDKINMLVKGFHEANPEKPRRFVIDSIRNSMEILYLKERYNAFYMIAVHNDGNEIELIRHKVSLAMFKKAWSLLDHQQAKAATFSISRMMHLNEIESDIEDFEKGRFYGPDLSRCVTESEIHIARHTVEEITEDEKLMHYPQFYTTAEQWMKFYSLIVRPGLITPSRDERCMSVAYVAKLNSGCISRQVGCSIVDQEASVLSVGWNDPPSAQLPCQLRYADELCHCGEEKYHYVRELGTKIFSNFELNGIVKLEDTDQQSRPFLDHMKENVKEETVFALREQGLRYPYCFRSRYNKFKGPKDQVNTRSLHAEENTMLRLAKQGGMGLNGGTMYVTASPCILCSKKAYQIGIKEIVYLDPYTDIAPDLILSCGYDQPKLRPFMGAIGGTFYKLYQPFMPYKDEITIWENVKV